MNQRALLDDSTHLNRRHQRSFSILSRKFMQKEIVFFEGHRKVVKLLPIKHSFMKTQLAPLCSTKAPKKLNQNEIDNLCKEFERAGKDIKIPTPWGHVAVKEFGKKGGAPVIMTHGWLDNLYSWALFVPSLLELNPDLHIIAFDEPGCGESTARPKGTYYESLSSVIEIRRIMDFMNWKKVSLIGHSKGAFSSFIFASIYPMLVDRIVAFDLFGPEVNFNRDLSELILKRIEMDKNFIEDNTGERFNKIYTKEKALERFVNSRPVFGLSKENAEILLKRGLKSYKGGYTFSRDIQWNFFSIELLPSRENIIELLTELQCDVQLLLATHGPFKVPANFWDPFRNVYKKRCKVFEEIEVEGYHYIHMDYATEMAKLVSKFYVRSEQARLENKL